MAENHIITARYDAGGYTKTRPAFQYDYGQVLVLEDFGDMLPSTFEMHFSIGGGKAITRIGTDGQVDIPNVCFERFGTVTAWLFLHDAETDGETKYVIETPVRSKAKTTDSEPTPEEQSTITQAIAALNAGVTAAETAQEAAETAQEAAEDARDDAIAAKTAAEAAQAGAESALADTITAAGQAQDDISEATQAAVQTVQNAGAGFVADVTAIKNQAGQYASNASASASAASSSATAAANSATDANSSREFADQSATAAQVAQGKAETAQSKAETAQTKAETAQGKAEAAQTAAETAKSNASASAEAAALSATAASGSATSAANSATASNTAKQAAVSAKTAAEQAVTDATAQATAASGSATAAAGSASDAAGIKSYLDENYGEISEDVSELKSAFTAIEDAQYTEVDLTLGAESTGYRIHESNGRAVVDANYKLQKYYVHEGETIHVVSDDRFQFQNNITIPTSGNITRVGDTYGAGEFAIPVPEGAICIVVSTPVENSQARVYVTESVIDSISEDVAEMKAVLPSADEQGPTLALSDAKIWQNQNGVAVRISYSPVLNNSCEPVEVSPNDTISITLVSRGASISSEYPVIGFITDESMTILKTLWGKKYSSSTETVLFVVPEGAKYLVLNQYGRAQPTNFVIKKYAELAVDADVKANADKITEIDTTVKGLMNETSATGNHLDYRKWREGSINAETGEFTPASATYKWILVGPFYVKPGVTYYGSYIRGYYFYDANGEYVSGWTEASMADYISQITIPEGISYITLSFYIGKSYQSYDSIEEYLRQTNANFREYGYLATTPFIPVTRFAEDIYDEYAFSFDRLKGQTIAVLGDSIGTRDGYNDPEILITEEDVGVELSAYLTYNDVQAGLSIAGHTFTDAEIGTEVTFTPTAEDVGKSIGVPLNHGGANALKWWQMLCERLEMNAVNASWSGTTMVSQESRSFVRKNYWASCAWYEPTIRRCGIRTPGTMTRTAPDYIFIHRGVNDFSLEHSGSVTVLTDNPFAAWDYAIPNTDQIEIDGATKYDFKQAYAMTIQKLRDAYPTAKIICCTLTPFRRNSETHYPPTNRYYSLPQFNAAIREVAEYFQCPVCEFAQAFPYERLAFYTGDNTHPNDYGHRAMYERALECLTRNMKFEG